jgi:hypothetical protein
VQAAFVATDGHAIGRIFEERTTFLAFVVQSVGGDFGFLVIAHLLIVDLNIDAIGKKRLVRLLGLTNCIFFRQTFPDTP